MGQLLVPLTVKLLIQVVNLVVIIHVQVVTHSQNLAGVMQLRKMIAATPVTNLKHVVITVVKMILTKLVPQEQKPLKGQTAVEAIGDGFSVDVPPEWIARLEQNGYIGHRVLMGYQTGEPAEDEDETTERPVPDSRFYFFDRTTENTIL